MTDNANAPRLRWRRIFSGRYQAGPWIVWRRNFGRHTSVWELTRGGITSHVGNFDTARRAKQHAADVEAGILAKP